MANMLEQVEVDWSQPSRGEAFQISWHQQPPLLCPPHTLWELRRNNKDKVTSGWELWYINYIEENKSTYSYVCQKFAWLSVSIFLANRIVLVVTGHVPKADASINCAVHAVLIQAPIWLGLPPHKVSNRTKRVHPEPVTLPVNASFCANNICQ